VAESIKLKLAREVCAEFKETPSLTLAKKLAKDHPAVYKDTEDARLSVRKVRGAHGDVGRKSKKDKTLFQEGNRPFNPFKLPESEETKFEPFVIKGHKKILVLADVHIPYHSIEAVTLAIREGKKEKVDGVLLLGDLLDFYQLSRFDKDPRKRSFAHELEAARTFFEVLQKQLKCKVYYKLGNHEERYQKYLYVKAPELLGVQDFELRHLLKLDEYNVQLIEDKRVVRMNKLNAIHGHEYPGVFSPVNIARGLFLKGKVSAIQGHNHTSSEHTEPNMNSEITTTWSIGCLCELNPAYMPLNKWNHGFAIIELDENGSDYHVRNKRIYKGKVL
jgi:predicted phosphodiesterase